MVRATNHNRDVGKYRSHRNLISSSLVGVVLFIHSAIVSAGASLMASLPQFAYEGWRFGSIDFYGWATISLVVCLLASLLEPIPNRVIDFVLWMLALFTVIPVIVYAQGFPGFTTAQVLGAQVSVVLGFVVVWTVGMLLPAPKVSSQTVGAATVRYVMAMAAIALVLAVLLLTLRGISSVNFSADAIYDRRGDFKDSAQTAAFVRYVTLWMGLVIAPFIMAAAFATKSWFLALCAGFCAVSVFATAGFKQPIAYLGLVALVALSLSVRRRWPTSPIPWFGVFTVAAGAFPLAWFYLSGSDWLFYLITRRLVLITGRIPLHYSAYADQEGEIGLFAPLANVLGSGGGSVAIEVGSMLGTGGVVNANSNLFSYGQVTAGAVGVTATAIAFATYLWAAERATSGRPLMLMIPAGAVISSTVMEMTLHTAMISGGLVLWLLLIVLSPSEHPNDGRRRMPLSRARMGRAKPPGAAKSPRRAPFVSVRLNPAGTGDSFNTS